MYDEGIADLNQLIIRYPYSDPGVKEATIAQIKDKARNRYFPAFEKVNGSSWSFGALRVERLHLC